MLPRNLPALLRAAGLTVIELDGWETRCRPASVGGFGPVGVLNHHTGASAKAWDRAKRLAYAKWMALTGRVDLPAPLVQLALGPDGEVYVCAAGRSNHAGTAKPSGSVAGGDGNVLYIGIEWMLSGLEAIPAKMMAAGITLNAVLTEKVTDGGKGTSVETISCHYQTSVTGKWDLADPSGVPFNGHRVLDVPKFRAAVAARRKALYHTKPVKPEPKSIVVNPAHVSMEFSDSVAQWKHDADAVFGRGHDWITGTEAGDPDRYKVLSASAKAHGYRIASFRSNWVAVKSSICVPGTYSVETKVVVHADQTVGHGQDTAYLVVTFTHRTKGVGNISVAASHYPRFGRPSAHKAEFKANLPWTTKIGQAISGVLGTKAKGKALGFAGVDSNIVDRTDDVFFGGPLTSCWDELGHWDNTGHGNIDVIASYDSDGRVKCLSAVAHDDHDLMLYTDHFLIDAKYQITLIH